jgi:LuxR family transcriptional regulator, maltose regulon positive regulatory protein
MEPASSAALPAVHRVRRRDSAWRRPPTRPRGLVARPRLVRRLSEARDAQFVLLVAPAGYGKTTLLSEWAAADGRRFAWIDLAGADNGADRLLAAVKRTLHAGQAPTVVVVDNAHLVSTPQTFGAVDELARSMPSGSQLALASRSEPELPIGSLRADRRMFELRARDMAMTRSEAHSLLSAAGIRVAGDGLDTLMLRTEGWPAGLYLAALSLGAQRNVDDALARFAGDDLVVADYLRDELLTQLEPDQLTFLLHTSVLDTLSGPLCDAVLEAGGSARMLGTLAHSNALLVSLDRAGTAYRHHVLFGEMLRAELRRLDPTLEPQLHSRATAWYEEHGEIDSAIQHAIAAGDPEQSGELLLRHASSYIGHGANQALQSWLDRFNEDQLSDVPALAVASAASRLASGEGDQARHWLAAATRNPAGRRSAGSPRVEAAVQYLGAMLAGDGLAPGATQHLTGDWTGARATLEEGARSSVLAAPHVQALCLAQLALLQMDEDDWSAATILSERARSRVEACGLADYPIAALVYAVSALVCSHAGRVEEAHRDLRIASRLAARLVDFVPWYEAETHVVLARASLGVSDVAGARPRLAGAARLVRRVPEATTLRIWLADACSQLEAATGSAADGLALTAAELRVLQVLPTHLSFPAIGTQLFVSTNTVKTHVRALYRKLDASSRSEAVAHAAAAGLLEHNHSL